MHYGYIGLDNKARKVKRIYVGINNIARKCVKGYAGVNGKAKLVFPSDVAIPSISGTYTYDTLRKNAIITNYDDDAVEIQGTISTTEAGVYNVIFKLKSQYYKWTDGTTENKTGTWQILPKAISVPTVSYNDLVYDGTPKSVTISDYNPSEILVSGTTNATNSSWYYVYFDLASSNYIWDDQTTARKSARWSIGRRGIPTPTVKGTYTYNGQRQTLVLNTDYPDQIYFSFGTNSAIDAGSYYADYRLVDKQNNYWIDTFADYVTVYWTINKAVIANPVPTIPVFNGTDQAPTWNYDSSLIVMTSNPTALHVVSRTATFKLTSDAAYDYQFDNGTSSKSITWTMQTAIITIVPVVDFPRYNLSVGTFVSGDFAIYNQNNYRIANNLRLSMTVGDTTKFSAEVNNRTPSSGTVYQPYVTVQAKASSSGTRITLNVWPIESWTNDITDSGGEMGVARKRWTFTAS